MNCLHCRGPTRARCRRGLCRHCYDRPEVRARYPLQGWLAHFGTAPLAARDFTGPAKVPPRPLTAEPGSPRKQQGLAERAAARQALHRSGDSSLRNEASTLERLAALLSGRGRG